MAYAEVILSMKERLKQRQLLLEAIDNDNDDFFEKLSDTYPELKKSMKIRGKDKKKT